MTDCKLDAWIKVQKNLSYFQNLVYETVQRLQPCTIEDVADFLHKRPNDISGRISELHLPKHDLMLIESCGRKDGLTLWRVI